MHDALYCSASQKSEFCVRPDGKQRVSERRCSGQVVVGRRRRARAGSDQHERDNIAADAGVQKLGEEDPAKPQVLER